LFLAASVSSKQAYKATPNQAQPSIRPHYVLSFPFASPLSQATHSALPRPERAAARPEDGTGESLPVYSGSQQRY